MAILVDRDILKAISDRDIVIEQFDPARLGTNSYDVTLAKTLMTYDDDVLDVRRAPIEHIHIIGPEGFTLQPGELYMGAVREYTDSKKHVPIINGKSSCGRLGLSVHVTAGTGDVGYAGYFTLELTVVKPLVVMEGMPIAQILWFEASGTPIQSYANKGGAKYTDAANPVPQASRMWKNFQ